MTRFYKKGENLVIRLNTLELQIPFDQCLYDFLVEISEVITVSDVESLLKQYSISPKIILLFLKIGILLSPETQLGREALIFHKWIANPSFLNFSEQVDPKNLDKIYAQIPYYFYDCFDQKGFSIIKYDQQWNKNYFIQRTKSTRKSSIDFSSRSYSLALFLKAIKNIFALSWESGLFFWSAWWFYSLFPVIVTNQNEIFIYDKYKNEFLIKRDSAVFEDFLSCYLYAEGTDFSLFSFHIVLVSSYVGCFNKYGNRGYRYIQMEAWAIWVLFRQICANIKIPQLEVQGYDDRKINQFLKKYINFNEDKGLVLHVIACG